MSMNAGLLQAVCFAALVLIFGYIFKKYPLKVTIQYLVMASLFVLLSVVLNALSLMVPFFGVPSVKITFALLPLMVAGVILPPSWAYLVGLVTDLIGLMITPTAFPFLGFTLNHVLVAVLPSLWYQRSQTIRPEMIQRAINIVFILLAIVASVYVWSLDSVSINQSDFVVTTTLKLSISGFICLFAIFIIIILRVVREKMDKAVVVELAKWMVVVVGIEILINLLLTPLWLDAMYGIPWFISTFIRIVKACVMLPLNIIIGYSLIKIVKRVSFR